MAEYIDRDVAIALAKDIIVPTKSGHDYRHRCIDPQDLAELPAADVRPVVQGRWIKPTRVPDSMLDECSICGFDAGAYTFNFCPNCGAQMIGGDEDV